MMRWLVVAICGALLSGSAQAQQPPSGPPRTAAEFLAWSMPDFVSPTPDKLFPGKLDLVVHAGDRLVSRCFRFYDEVLPSDLTEQEIAQREANSRCIYPPADKDASYASSRFYIDQLKKRGFADHTGTYGQSGMLIFCSSEGFVVFQMLAITIPTELIGKNGNRFDVKGGGGLGHMGFLVEYNESECPN